MLWFVTACACARAPWVLTTAVCHRSLTQRTQLVGHTQGAAQEAARFSEEQRTAIIAAYTLARADAVRLYKESCRMLQGIYVSPPPPLLTPAPWAACTDKRLRVQGSASAAGVAPPETGPLLPAAQGLPQPVNARGRLASLTLDMHNCRQAFHLRAWTRVSFQLWYCLRRLSATAAALLLLLAVACCAPRCVRALTLVCADCHPAAVRHPLRKELSWLARHVAHRGDSHRTEDCHSCCLPAGAAPLLLQLVCGC